MLVNQTWTAALIIATMRAQIKLNLGSTRFVTWRNRPFNAIVAATLWIRIGIWACTWKEIIQKMKQYHQQLEIHHQQFHPIKMMMTFSSILQHLGWVVHQFSTLPIKKRSKVTYNKYRSSVEMESEASSAMEKHPNKKLKQRKSRSNTPQSNLNHCSYYCDYESTTKVEFKKHEMRHVNKQAFQCHRCSYSVNTDQNLRVHLKRDHPKGEPARLPAVRNT